mmetsp:Transcript_106981/g.332406  ORF Transcript_106981/g.332406 Transcript_106981/m.332406 type:complete len:330 (-) Transcript_106981:63-1052(-)
MPHEVKHGLAVTQQRLRCKLQCSQVLLNCRQDNGALAADLLRCVLQRTPVLQHCCQDNLAVAPHPLRGVRQQLAFLPHRGQHDPLVVLGLLRHYVHGQHRRVLLHGQQHHLRVALPLPGHILQGLPVLPHGSQGHLRVVLVVLREVGQDVPVPLDHGQDNVTIHGELLQGEADGAPVLLHGAKHHLVVGPQLLGHKPQRAPVLLYGRKGDFPISPELLVRILQVAPVLLHNAEHSLLVRAERFCDLFRRVLELEHLHASLPHGRHHTVPISAQFQRGKLQGMPVLLDCCQDDLAVVRDLFVGTFDERPVTAHHFQDKSSIRPEAVVHVR